MGADIKELQNRWGVVKEVECRFQNQEIPTWNKMYTKDSFEFSCTRY